MINFIYQVIILLIKTFSGLRKTGIFAVFEGTG